MTTQLARTHPNWITFPRKLRDAIPDFQPCSGRVLELASADAQPVDSEWIGRRVRVKLCACETGKLNGTFDVWLSLNPSAAEALADVLRAAAEQAKQ
ncbi:MAG TPA: hypothetical protein VG297_05205 [Bryobacteraceae bacterium]|jgi:hypothetical protein|nr:hypothetical protein [Bryobacteraceae bacterium]